MKKGFLIFLMGIVSFLGINTVSAEEIYFEYDTEFNEIKSNIDTIGTDKLNEIINNLIDYYELNYSNSYPYYHISLVNSDDQLDIYLNGLNSLNFNYGHLFKQSFSSYYNLPNFILDFFQLRYSYNFSTQTLSELFIAVDGTIFKLFEIDEDSKYYNPYSYYYSNFDFYYYGNLFTNDTDDLRYLNPDDTLYIPRYDEPTTFSVHKANSKFLIEPYYLYDNNESLREEKYTTIDLNQYPYVALSLKDYDNIPENNHSTYTNIFVKGQLCITPVYNYGMTERKDVLTGTQVQRCSLYYNDFTTTRMYLLKTDVENHAIYYLKAYDTTKDNIIKVDTSVFDISYITEDTKDNPYVNISGKQYPTIAYDKLTDTATKSEDEDYISGVSCPVGDFNCYNEYNSENIFDSIFDSPLKILKNIWSSITSVFDIITEFIMLLPEAMQSFLFLSFMIAIILGLIKIIL